MCTICFSYKRPAPSATQEISQSGIFGSNKRVFFFFRTNELSLDCLEFWEILGFEKICITRYNWVFGVKINNYVVLVSKRLGGSVSGPPDTTLRTGIDLSHSVRALYCRRFGVMVVAGGGGGGGGVDRKPTCAKSFGAFETNKRSTRQKRWRAKNNTSRCTTLYIYIYYRYYDSFIIGAQYTR